MWKFILCLDKLQRWRRYGTFDVMSDNFHITGVCSSWNYAQKCIIEVV